VLAAYQAGVLPALAAGKNVLLVSHGNALRALIRHLENLDDKTLLQTEVPTGKPLVYDLNDKLKINGRRWL
jgi:2,3-bisphosphoglycerate-dependent phosphoglycerate mutase